MVREMLELLQRHRLRLARLTLVAGILVAVLHVWPQLPRETDLEFALGPGHSEIVELRVSYVHQGEEWYGVRLGFPEGAPDRVRHSVSLPAGEFELRCELRDRNGRSRLLVRHLRTPAEDVVRVALGQA
jgi:hypothetical protein